MTPAILFKFTLASLLQIWPAAVESKFYPGPKVDTGELQFEYEAMCAILDPAKLAELMAMALRARGFWTRAEFSHDGAYFPELRKVVQTVAHYLVFADYEANCEEHELGCCISDICEHYVINVHDGSLSEWRTKLLAIMATPPDESSRETCENILKGNS